MQLTAGDITVAITVFNRRQFLRQAISSALEQTIPVRVIVVEDCGPDPTLQSFIQTEFGSRIQYFRNPIRRGLFGNWNACLERCSTSWISILHDDDFLDRKFIEAMLELNRQAPDCGLYFGATQIVDDSGRPQAAGMRPPLEIPWRRVELGHALDVTPFPFPGNLFQVDQARAVGGFNDNSQFCGDWEMWCRLIAFYGAAESAVTVAYNRSHVGLERGTSKITMNGRLRPLVFVQQKRVLNLMRQTGTKIQFDRGEFLRKSPMSIKYLLAYGADLSPRLRAYLFGLLLRSHPPGPGYAAFRMAAKLLGQRIIYPARCLLRFTGSTNRPRNNDDAAGRLTTAAPPAPARQV